MMNDEDSLLAAITAHPEEDTPRLAFADWLDEHDRPVRAEFVRAQIALKANGNLSTEERQKLAHRQQFLLEKYRRDLVGPLGADLISYEVLFDRGFVSELRVTALLFIQRAEEFGELRPIPRVCIRNLNRAAITRFIRPELACVTSIAVRDPGPNVVPALTACPYLSRLESLDWTVHGPGDGLGDPGLVAIAFSDNVPQLTDLDAANNEISDLGVERLVASPLWRRLKRLNLSRNQLTRESAERLANAPGNQIEYLGLHGVHVGAIGRRRLVAKYGERVWLG